MASDSRERVSRFAPEGGNRNLSTQFIHCTRCDCDVPTHGYSQHLLEHVRQTPKREEKSEEEPLHHKFGDSRCLATAGVDTAKKPELKGQRKRARAALLKAQKEEKVKKQEEAKKEKEFERRQREKREARALSKEIATGRSHGTPYSALTISKGKKWKGWVHFIPGGSPGSKR